MFYKYKIVEYKNDDFTAYLVARTDLFGRTKYLYKKSGNLCWAEFVDKKFQDELVFYGSKLTLQRAENLYLEATGTTDKMEKIKLKQEEAKLKDVSW